MILRLPYGRGDLTADLRGLRCLHLAPSAPRGGAAGEAASDALDHPVDGAPLTALARGRRRVVVLVPDATRRSWLDEVLPPLLGRLGGAGVPASATTVLVACGTHPPASEDRLRELVGPLPPGVALAQHDSRDPDALVPVGTTPTGLEVRLDRRAAEADLLVAVSTVQHHYFAGFGGGPKLVFPGVAGYEEIQTNHSRVLDVASETPRRHGGCEPGVLAGNPVAEEVMQAARLCPPHVSLLLVAGSDGRPAWAAAGSLETTFPRACEQVARWYEVEAGPVEKIVVAGGGYPADHTLIQAHKALDAACRFLIPGGEALFVASCEGGPGSDDMAPFLADPREGAILGRLAESYVQYGHTTLRLLEKTGRYRIHAVTGLADELASRLGFHPVADPQAILDEWRTVDPGAAVGVMVGAPVYPARS